MIDPQWLKQFSPLDSLAESGLLKAAEASTVRKLKVGEVLFQKGETDHPIYFLLEGDIALRSDPGSPQVLIRAGTEAALTPLSRLKPRRYTATANTDVQVAELDEDLLDNLLTADQTAAYRVTEIQCEDPEWLFQLICNPAFAKIPTDNFARLFNHLQAMAVRDGQAVIRQGEAGDYYYIIRRGEAHVWRAQPGDEAVMVAKLGVGDAFGEEALLSGEPRNATVVMQGDGLLMRLAMTDFNTLLEPALVKRIDPSTAANLIGSGARFIDVRTEPEYREYSLPSSINMPLGNLRELSGQLDAGRKYISVCQTGRRSTAAAFLLSQRGFDVWVLDGGLNGIKPAF